MNTKNNKRRRESVTAIERAFIVLLQERDFKEITVSDICKDTGLNRSTFYANFVDIFDLANHMRQKLEADFSAQFQLAAITDRADASLRMFRHIYENQLFYKTYFKLGYEKQQTILTYDKEMAEQAFHGKHVDYHIEFFRAGLNAIIVKWLESGCRESPEEMNAILIAEYRGR